MKHKNIILTGIILAGLAVILGAFGAHGLKQLVSEGRIEVFKTGVQYQFYHAVAIIVTGILGQFFESKYLKFSFYSFIFGILCFSGSLYLFTYFEAVKTEGPAWLGPITPLGGLGFIIGWVFLAISVFKK